MSRISGFGKITSFILLMVIALYAAHFTTRIKISDEHVAFSRAAAEVPFSGPVGDAVICAYGQLWNVQCAAASVMPELNLPEIATLDLPVRYLCAANPVLQSMECADRNMVGVATVLTIVVGTIAAAAAWLDSSRLQNRQAAALALARYCVCIAASVLLLWHLGRVSLTTIWIGNLDERIIASRPILAFTGNIIGYGLLIALAGIGVVGSVAAALAIGRR